MLASLAAVHSLSAAAMVAPLASVLAIWAATAWRLGVDLLLPVEPRVADFLLAGAPLLRALVLAWLVFFLDAAWPFLAAPLAAVGFLLPPFLAVLVTAPFLLLAVADFFSDVFFRLAEPLEPLARFFDPLRAAAFLLLPAADFFAALAGFVRPLVGPDFLLLDAFLLERLPRVFFSEVPDDPGSAASFISFSAIMFVSCLINICGRSITKIAPASS